MAVIDGLLHILAIYDGESEEPIGAIELRNAPLQALLIQFDVDQRADPTMRDRYAVGPDDVALLRRYIPEDVTFDFTRNAYFIEAVIDDQ